MRQSIQKTMNNSITDNGTPNIHIITNRVIESPSPVRLPGHEHDRQFRSPRSQMPNHSAASMPLRQ
jgi:hypothetical protein